MKNMKWTKQVSFTSIADPPGRGVLWARRVNFCFFSSAKQKKQMTKDGFLMYLHQDEGCILDPAHKHIYQDMRQPLNNYFISSSHNTYLMEDQLKGPSSTEAYIK